MKDLNVNLLRKHQREELKAELENYEKMLPFAKGDDRALVLRRKADTIKMLETQSPEPLTPKEKDKLHGLEKQLRDKITENMPTDEVMRKNPAGAVDWNTKWLNKNKKLIRIWKNIRVQLNPDSGDRDLANIERYRPQGAQNRLRTDAQIPGALSYSDIPDDLWPFEAPQNTALAQANRRFDEEQAALLVEASIQEAESHVEDPTDKGYGPNKNYTLEEWTALQDRLAKARQAKADKKAVDMEIAEKLTA
ncbi:MAG: hypothetical protein L0287_01725 [Anaerolineae bacterium]|nr:hypothetical protein [Anaerolineae bacterium]